jgi:DNA-binding transcriptional regulator LsrR (DeoR family)
VTSARRSSSSRPRGDGPPASTRDAARLLTAAYLYYVDDLPQAKIALQLGVHRTTVSRLLAEAREAGVVRIEIMAGPVDPAIEERLAARLGLERVHAAPGIADEADPGPLLSVPFGQALRDCRLAADDALVISWGRAPWSLAQLTLPTLGKIEVLPAVAGFSEDEPWFQTNEIVRRVAVAIGGHARLLHAPSLPSVQLRSSLLADPGIAAVVGRWDRAGAIVAGIGAWPKRSPRAAPVAITADGGPPATAIGDVCSRYFDADGNPVRSETEDRLLAISREQILRIPHRIGVAVGVAKTHAIIAAARSRLINVLVTDLVTASAVWSQVSDGALISDEASS